MIKRIKESVSGAGTHPQAGSLRPAPNPPLKSGKETIRVTEPVLGDSEMEALQRSMQSGFISSAGEAVHDFEERLARHCATEFSLATSCGTHALDLLIYAFDLKPGDEVIVPALTFISVGATIARAGARPVFVDVDKSSLNLIPRDVERAITPQTKGIIGVHTFGHPCDMRALKDIADRHDLFLIEDACEALGASFEGQPVGGLGDAAVHSFYANKMITTGNGGAITTNHKELAKFLRQIRGYSYEPERFFWHHHMPFNARMSSLQAAVGCAQLDKLETLVDAKLEVAKGYQERLHNTPDLTLPSPSSQGQHIYWMYTVHTERSIELRRSLADAGIETRPVFSPLHVQPVLQEASAPVQGPFPNSEWAARTGVNLPSGANLTSTQLDRISEVINNCLS